MNFFLENGHSTAYRQIEKHTYDEFYHEIQQDITETPVADSDPVENAIATRDIEKMIYKPLYTKEIEELGRKFHNAKRHSRSLQYENLYSTAILTINKIEADADLLTSLSIIQGVRSELGDKFFGALLQPTGKGSTKSFNPLNPLIAVTLRKIIDTERGAVFKQKFSILVYSFNHENGNKRYHDRLKEREKKVDFKEDVQNTMVAAHISRGLSERYGSFRRDTETTASIDMTIRDKNGNSAHIETASHVLVPIQIANSGGLMYPSYGAVIFNREAAMNLSPYHSANLGTPGGVGRTWSNVCTGNLNASTDSGKASMNHSNNTSPLNRINIGENSLQWADTCCQMSLDLLLGVEEEEAEAKKRMTFVEYKAEHGEVPISVYVEYIRKLNEEELPEW